MIYLKYFPKAIADVLLLLTVPFAAAIIAAFTRAQPQDHEPYTWGGIYGTHDNPPQGDQGYVSTRAPFPNRLTGFKGYVNRAFWMIRNPLYGLAKRWAIPYERGHVVTWRGNASISDKYKIDGSYFAKCHDKRGRLVAFEYYLVAPWSATRCLRVRIGYKIMSSKFQDYGFAQLVNSANPFKSYGEG